MADPTIVSLSTIPPRFKYIGETLRSILKQSLPVDEVRVYIPKSYRRFPDWDGVLPEVPEGVSTHRCDQDYGPATKILPAMRDLAGQAADILFCDDDLIYDSGWHQRFKSLRAQMPNTCLVEAGETFPDIADSARPADRLPRITRRTRGIGYRLFRALTLTMIKPHGYTSSGFVDQISAYAGVMVRPGWLDDLAYDIPDILWTVDDPWISGHLERMNIPIWLNANARAPKGGVSSRTHALNKLVEKGHDRVKADVAVIEYFRQKHGIWLPAGVPQKPNKDMTSSIRELARRAN